MLPQHSPWISTHMFPVTLCGTMCHGHQHRSQLQQDHGPRHGPQQCLRPDLTIPHFCGITGYPDKNGPSDSTALGYQNGLKWLTRPWASAQPPVATGTTDINSDCGWCSTVHPDMALSSSSDLNDTMVPCDSTSRSDQQDPVIQSTEFSEVRS